MKTLRLAVLTALVAAFVAAPAAAGNLGIYFDKDATVDQMHFETGVPFYIHVAMTEMNDSVNAVEFMVEMPPEILILAHEWLEGSWAFPWAGAPAGTPPALGGVQLGLGDCYYMGDQWNPRMTVLTLTCMSMSDLSNASVSLTGFPGTNGDVVPRYAQCPSTDLFQMSTTSGTFNVSVPAPSSSWGAMKAGYSDPVRTGPTPRARARPGPWSLWEPGSGW